MSPVDLTPEDDFLEQKSAALAEESDGEDQEPEHHS